MLNIVMMSVVTLNVMAPCNYGFTKTCLLLPLLAFLLMTETLFVSISNLTNCSNVNMALIKLIFCCFWSPFNDSPLICVSMNKL
jgi:hypothetical protein